MKEFFRGWRRKVGVVIAGGGVRVCCGVEEKCRGRQNFNSDSLASVSSTNTRIRK